MHYYKKNIGDYAKKTGRLSMLQHGAYTLLLDSCYDREKFPTLEEAIEWTWASSKEEIEAVEFVLRKFFIADEDGRFVQSRVKEELDNYHETAVINKRIALDREAKRRENSTNRIPTVNEAPPNQEPRTTNQEPRTTKKNTAAKAAPLPVDWSVSDDMLEFCKRERPDLKPEKVEEAFKDYWTNGRGMGKKMLDWAATWRSWVRKETATPYNRADRQNNGHQHQESFFERDQRAKRKSWEEMTGRKWPEESQGEIVDMPTMMGIGL